MKSRRALLVFTLLATIVGCQPATEKTIPDDLLGVWKTSEPKYADRFFEIKKDALIFGTGGDNTDIYSVASVEQAHDDVGLLYNIHYLNLEGQQYTFSIYYAPTNDGVIRFKNQKHFTWTRERH
ncbi:MAG: hypothetical protein ACE5JQ_01415 [Candidatus Methylomirabilales bacterium]